MQHVCLIEEEQKPSQPLKVCFRLLDFNGDCAEFFLRRP